MAKKKGAGGRPSKYRSEFANDLIEHMKTGGSIEAFPGYLYIKYGGDVRVVEKTIYNWFENHEEFLQAKELGLSLARLWFDNLSKTGMAGQLKVVDKEVYDKDGRVVSRTYRPATFGQSFAAIAYKNRFGWRDKMEHSGTIESGLKGESYAKLMADPEKRTTLLEAAELLAEIED